MELMHAQSPGLSLSPSHNFFHVVLKYCKNIKFPQPYWVSDLDCVHTIFMCRTENRQIPVLSRSTSTHHSFPVILEMNYYESFFENDVPNHSDLLLIEIIFVS